MIASDSEDNIVIKSSTKVLGLGLIPTKRYFYSSGHSKTYNI